MILSPCHTLLDASGFRGPTGEAVALGFQSFDLFLDLREQNQEKKKKNNSKKTLYNNKTSLILGIGIQMNIKVPHFASKSLVC